MRGLIALIVIVVLALCVVLMAKTSAKPGSALPPVGPTVTTGVTAILPVKIVLECEEPATLDDKTPDGKVILKVAQQSEGTVIRFLEMPPRWIKACGFEKQKGKAGALPGKASYVFEAPRDDTYYIALRAKWYDNCGNSVWVEIDEGEWFNLEDQNGQIGVENYRWAWHQLLVSGRPKGFQLTKGRHTLWLNTREDGPKLDQWVISTEANPPVGEAAQKR